MLTTSLELAAIECEVPTSSLIWQFLDSLEPSFVQFRSDFYMNYTITLEEGMRTVVSRWSTGMV